ncbi:ATP/GTP-binding protein [Streptomyces sp. SRF1]|uniref:ATP/GTP-binding protein n=1 Tax=Streptomyces sp. SRF1 TaxID=1549642 RepID=UPI0025B1633D|nr:ATP/GTP-binding protein [Streptomyces sp. SRF1]MDN3059403.1 ATP/GTP-binding protein [Streptomyces sp. SRF1]
MDDLKGHAEASLVLKRLAVAAAGGALIGAALPSAAHADSGGNGVCGGTDSWVSVCATDPGSPGSEASPARPAKPRKGAKGQKASFRSCVVKKLDPQPPAGSAVWKGHDPGDGAIYTRSCVFDAATSPVTAGVPLPDQTFWSATPPAAAGPDPAQLAQQAVDKMLLKGPDIVSPDAAGRWTVGVPVWMHAGKSPATYGPTSASATAGAVTVTATAKVASIKWQMGDGSTVTCTGAGTPYRKAYGKRTSPDCGHTYARTSASEPDKKYTVTATATWVIEWNGGGQSGELTEIRESQVEVSVGELQALG